MNSDLNYLLDSSAGKAQDAHGESLNTFLASLATSATILGLGTLIYTFLKYWFPRYLSQQLRQTQNLDLQPISIFRRMLACPPPDNPLRNASSLDNYFFDRYLHTITKIFLLLGLIIPPILIPLNVVDGKNEAGGVKGLDCLSFSNVGFSHTSRYWAHLVIAVSVVVSICLILRYEEQEYTRIQKMYQVDVSRCLLISTSVRKLTPNAIRRTFHKTAGGIRSLAANRDYSSLRSKLRRRDELLRKLETAQTTFIMKANFNKKTVKINGQVGFTTPVPRCTVPQNQKDRPSIGVSPPLPSLGARVDAIHHLTAEYSALNREIERDQQHPENFPETGSYFIHFNRGISTRLSTLALKARVPPDWRLRYGTTSSDTIWSHVSIGRCQQYVRTAIVYALVTAITLGFAAPVTIIGSLSQIRYLTDVVPWLHWIRRLPDWLLAFVQGVLPPVFLAAITAAVPMAIRLITNKKGLHSRRATENYIQIYYFTFLFLQGFLTISMSAGITTVIGELDYTIEAVPSVLAQNLPKACNYFFSYIFMNTVISVVSILIHVKKLVNLAVLSPIFDKTARQKWERGEISNLQQWGTLIPVFTNVACIGLIYSVIAPLVIFFSVIYFGALWVLYRSYPPTLTELRRGTCGVFYPTAIRQLFTGIYFMELCLAGLFFLVRDANGKATCTLQAIIMIVVTALTVLFHSTMHLQWKFWLLSGRHGEVNQLSPAYPRSPQSDSVQDEALIPSRPVIWIPKDEWGMAEDEISNARITGDILMSNEGASIDKRGKLEIWGDPPSRG